MKISPIVIFSFVFIFSQCKVNKNNTSANTTQERILNEITVTDARKQTSPAPYQSSQKQYFDLIHTTLWLSFDYEHQHVLGKAKISLKPHFYPQQKLELDAKKFILNRVALLNTDTLNLKYSYDESIITIELDRTYTKDETIDIYIDYTARPNEITEEGSAAISEAKGLYFINPTRAIADKPRQIWSQGETQSNCGWFPTIDYPNQKMTQDIYLTVDSSDITLSNGLLVYSREKPDGKRVDYWSQSLPHAPYLTMIAIGEFTETKDTWRDSMEVNYYLEKKYEPFAKLIFGNTPQMLECFSNRLGVDYPWEKFSQVVVRDFVSGAMENTSAVVHFEPVQHDNREHLDNNWEGIIAHELFHHWFGDLVTCETWSNISLNESFATYGEYLWNEYKYGKIAADYSFDNNLQAYLRQKNAHKKELIRYHYKNREEVFDVVSYQKGSRVIHMLRNYVGDDAFFASLKYYLNTHKFQTVEIHDLRLAFEHITGEDLSWFFNQWYFNSGHPKLDIEYTYNETNTAVKVHVLQTQDTLAVGVFKLPVAIDVYDANGKAYRKKVWVDKADWEIVIELQTKIELTNFDADKILLAQITENKTPEEYIFQLVNAPQFLDKEQAANAIAVSNTDKTNPLLLQGITNALNHPFYGIRELGMQLAVILPENERILYENKILSLAQTDSVASVRANAIGILSEWNPDNYKNLFTNAVNDSAYSVVGAALKALAEVDGQLAIAACKPYMANKNKKMQLNIANIIANHAITDYTPFFEEQLNTPTYFSYQFFPMYATYLSRQDTAIQLKALPKLQEWHSLKHKSIDYATQVEQTILPLHKFYTAKKEEAEQSLLNKKITAVEKVKWTNQLNEANSMLMHLDACIKNDE